MKVDMKIKMKTVESVSVQRAGTNYILLLFYYTVIILYYTILKGNVWNKQNGFARVGKESKQKEGGREGKRRGNSS